MTEHGIDQKVQHKIIGILKVLHPNAKIYLYGSRARGDFRQWSDIDLALDIGSGNPRIALGEARSVMEALSIPYSIDLVDANHVQEPLRTIIKKEGILWSN